MQQVLTNEMRKEILRIHQENPRHGKECPVCEAQKK